MDVSAPRIELSLAFSYYEDGCRYKSSLGQGFRRAASTPHQTLPFLALDLVSAPWEDLSIPLSGHALR